MFIQKHITQHWDRVIGSGVIMLLVYSSSTSLSDEVKCMHWKVFIGSKYVCASGWISS